MDNVGYVGRRESRSGMGDTMSCLRMNPLVLKPHSIRLGCGIRPRPEDPGSNVRLPRRALGDAVDLD